MTLKAELPVFPEGGIYPPLSRKTKIPPLAENTPLWKFWSFPLPGIDQLYLFGNLNTKVIPIVSERAPVIV